MHFQIAHVYEGREFYVKKPVAYWIDDAFNPPTADWTLSSGLKRADYEHDVKPDGLLPPRLLQNSCMSALIPYPMTYEYLHKCSYQKTSFGLLHCSIILRAHFGQSSELFAARASSRRAICHEGKTLISMVVARPVLSRARTMI